MPGSSTSFALGIREARYRALPTSNQRSFVRCRTSVGTDTPGRMSRTSIWEFIRTSAVAIPGLAPARR